MTTSLLEVAYEAFRKNGYKKTSVAQLTQAAGMVTGSFYKYYVSKEAVVGQFGHTWSGLGLRHAGMVWFATVVCNCLPS